MKKILIIIIIALSTIQVNAQWQLTTCPLGSGDGILSLATNGNYVFAGVEGLGVNLSTNNGGPFWNPMNNGLTSSYITSFTVKGSDVFAGTDAGIFRSSNNGTNWSVVNNGLTMTFITSMSNNGTSIFAGAGFGQIFRSDNNGALWTEISNGLPSSTSAMTTCFAYKDGNVFEGMTGEGVYKSSNNGLNWTASNNGMTEPVVYSLLVSGTTILAATLDGLYASVDDGSNWNSISLGIPYFTAYCFAKSGSNLYMGTDKGIFLSTNDGATWDSINTGLTNRNVEMLAINGTYLFANERQTGVWRRPLTEIIGMKEINKLDDLALFPNPAIDEINIETPQTLQEAFVSVYNINGVLLFSQPIHESKTVIDISMLATGVYFIKLNSNKSSKVEKFIKE